MNSDYKRKQSEILADSQMTEWEQKRASKALDALFLETVEAVIGEIPADWQDYYDKISYGRYQAKIEILQKAKELINAGEVE